MENPESTIASLARLGATDKEIADQLGIPEELLTTKYSLLLAKARSDLHLKLRAKQMELAMEGDKTTLLWLAKSFLSQSGRPADSPSTHTGIIDPATRKDDTDDQLFDRS